MFGRSINPCREAKAVSSLPAAPGLLVETEGLEEMASQSSQATLETLVMGHTPRSKPMCQKQYKDNSTYF